MDKLQQQLLYLKDGNYDPILRNFRRYIEGKARYWSTRTKYPVPFDDLVSVGLEGCWEACQTFDLSYDNFQACWFTNKIDDKIANYATWHGRAEQTVPLSLNEKIGDEDDQEYIDLLQDERIIQDEYIDEKEFETRLRQVIQEFAETLNERERTLLYEYLLTPYKAVAIKNKVGMTSSNINYMKGRIIDKLKVFLNEHGHDEELVQWTN